MSLPLDPDVDARTWAYDKLAASAAGLEPLDSSIGLDAAAAALARAVDRARALWDEDNWTPISMAFQPDPLGPVLALLDAVVCPGAELPSPPELVAPMGDVNLRVVRPVDTSEVTVPAGPATRFRTPFAPYPGNGGGIRFPVAGAVGYGIRPPGLPGFVLLSGRWFHAGLGDVLAGQIDELAGRLEIAFNQ